MPQGWTETLDLPLLAHQSNTVGNGNAVLCVGAFLTSRVAGNLSYFGRRRENAANSPWNPTFTGNANDKSIPPGNGASVCFESLQSELISNCSGGSASRRDVSEWRVAGLAEWRMAGLSGSAFGPCEHSNLANLRPSLRWKHQGPYL